MEELTVTPAAGTKITELAAADGVQPMLRVAVIGGGCGGFQYDLHFDQPGDDDLRFESEGITVLVDKFSHPYLKGTSIDFVDGFKAGFTLDNPNATGGCGCGKSFTADDVDLDAPDSDAGCGGCHG